MKKVLFFALIIRLFLAFGYEGTGDTGHWRLLSRTVLEDSDLGLGHGKLYDGSCQVSCVNLPPLSAHLITIARILYLNFNPFNFKDYGFYKLFSVLHDVGIIMLIYQMAKHLKFRNPFKTALLYAFHPIAIYVSSYHGQLDSIWLFYTLLSAYFVMRKKVFLAALFLGIATAFKLPAIIFLLLFFFIIKNLRKKLLFLTIYFAAFFILSLPEIVTQFNGFINQVILYKGWSGWWGFAKFGLPFVINKTLMYFALLGSSYFFARKNIQILKAILGIIVIIYIFTPIFAVQYLLWILPFLVLLAKSYSKFFKLYSISSIFFAINFYGIPIFQPINHLLVEIPQQKFFYKLPFLKYPMDLGLFIWLSSIYFIIHFYKKTVKTTKI